MTRDSRYNCLDNTISEVPDGLLTSLPSSSGWLLKSPPTNRPNGRLCELLVHRRYDLYCSQCNASPATAQSMNSPLCDQRAQLLEVVPKVNFSLLRRQ